MSLTAHCLVKNEENFIEYAVRSVVDFVDSVLIFDTGSEDTTIEKIKKLQDEFPTKILFEEKGSANKERHTALRQEMIERTKTDWFMVLDGDEVWTNEGMQEAMKSLDDAGCVCIIAPFYLCVGDIYHYSQRGAYNIRGKLIHATPRFFKKSEGLHWQGSYDNDFVADAENKPVFEGDKVKFLKNGFWHVSHLRRSSSDNETYSSGKDRRSKRRLTHFLIGRKIPDLMPGVFETKPSLATAKLGWVRSFVNFVVLAIKKLSV